MSDTPSDGGPAFPNAKTVTAVCPDSGRVQETYVVRHGGMSLRDYFAGQAIVAICRPYHSEYARQEDAEAAYAIADAMIAARGGGSA